MFIQLCVSYTDSGIDLLRAGMAANNVSQRDYHHCIKLLLGFERWCIQFNPIGNVENAIGLVGEIIDLIKSCFLSLDGNGWDVPRFTRW